MKTSVRFQSQPNPIDVKFTVYTHTHTRAYTHELVHMHLKGDLPISVSVLTEMSFNRNVSRFKL